MFSKDEIAAQIPTESLYDINGVVDVEYPVELNAYILVMNDGTRYRVSVQEESEKSTKGNPFNYTK